MHSYIFFLIGVLVSFASVALDWLPGSSPGFGPSQMAVLVLGALVFAIGLLPKKAYPLLVKAWGKVRDAIVIVVLLIVATDLSARVFTIFQQRSIDGFFYISKFYTGVTLPARYNPINPFLLMQPNTRPPFNSEGFRTTHSVRSPKAPGEIRVFSLGGSTTANLATSVSYPELWERMLSDEMAVTGNTIKVFNAARDAYSTNQSLVRLATDVIHMQPDIITIMHTANDLHELFFLEDGSADSPRNAKYQHPAYFFLKRLNVKSDGVLRNIIFHPGLNQHRLLNIVFDNLSKGVIERVQRKEVVFPEEFIVRGLDEFRNNLIEIVRLSRAYGVKVLFFSQPMNFKAVNNAYFERVSYSIRYPSLNQYTELHRRYTDVIREVAEAEGAVFAPMKEKFKQLSNSDSFFLDAMHYNEDGVGEFARLSLPYIRDAVRSLNP